MSVIKIIVIILLILLAYTTIGYTFALCCAAYNENDLMDDPYYILSGVFWPISMPITFIFLLARFIAKKLAIIPISIIMLNKGREK